jgi:hypothetical protein
MLFAAVLFCQTTEIMHIDASPIACISRTFTTADGIPVWSNGTFPFTDRVSSKDRFFAWGIPICANVHMSDGAATFRDAIVSTFPRKHIPSDTVVMNMRGSFARAALYLSPVKKIFSVFEGDPDSINGLFNMFFHRFLEHGDHWNCMASQAYRNRITRRDIGNWSAIPDQLAFLLRDKCEWTRVTIANRSYVPRPPSTHDVA